MLVDRSFSGHLTARVNRVRAGGQYRLLGRNRIRRWKGILKGLIERLFVPLALALAANAVILVNFVFWLGDHLEFLDRIPKTSGNLRKTEQTANMLSEDNVEMMSGRGIGRARRLSSHQGHT
jgi:hypothetical protein